MKFIITREGQNSSPRRAQRIEDLGCSVIPYLNKNIPQKEEGKKEEDLMDISI